MTGVSLSRNLLLESEWRRKAVVRYEKQPVREGVHVSTLLLCIRQKRLVEDFHPDWTNEISFRFIVGEVFEDYIFDLLLPGLRENLVVQEDGIIGSIDIPHETRDVECKATFSFEPKDISSLIDDKFWWFEQIGSYAIMRRRKRATLAVLYIKPPSADLRVYDVDFTTEYLAELWQAMKNRRKYYLKHKESGTYPPKTVHTWLCPNCIVRDICFSLEENREKKEKREKVR